MSTEIKHRLTTLIPYAFQALRPLETQSSIVARRCENRHEPSAQHCTMRHSLRSFLSTLWSLFSIPMSFVVFPMSYKLSAMSYFSRSLRSLLLAFCLAAAIILPAHPSLGQSKAYSIGPRDVLTLTIYAGGEKQLEVSLTVSSQGMINVPFVGPIKAEGLTIPDLVPLIKGPLAEDYFVNPEVNILMKEYHSLQYYVSGAVGSPGLYETSSQATLMELIAKAGGVSPERGNIAYILRESTNHIKRGKRVESLLTYKEPIKVDLKRLLDKGDMSQNVLLKPGDVVYIPLQRALNLGESKIYVEGEVKNPGVYDFQEGLTALNACILAGGFSEFAAPNRTRIVRKDGDKQKIIKVNLNDVKKGKIPDAELKPGDRIHVPETWL